MKNCLKSIRFIVILLFVLFGWQKLLNEVSGKKGIIALGIALQEADENKEELEKVLCRYQKAPSDSLKYKAACFLIENMSFYIYSVGEQLENYNRKHSLYGSCLSSQSALPLSKT